MKKRLLALLLCLVLALTMLSACGKSEEQTGTNTGSSTTTTDSGNDSGETTTDEGETGDASVRLDELPMPLTEEKESLRVLTFYSNSYIEDPNEIHAVQVMEEKTNVHIDWQIIDLNTVAEQWGLILASGDLPDLMYPTESVGYPGGTEKGVEDGVFMEMNYYVENFMPNYRDMVAADPELAKDVKTDSGRMVSVFGFNSTDTEITAQPQWAGLVVRRDLLDKWGYTGTPETVADWEELLTLAKENGCDAPFMTGSNGYNYSASFLTAYGLLPGMFQRDGKITYVGIEPAYRDYVQLMHDWYEKGLLDPNFVSNNASMMPDFSYSASDRSVAYEMIVGFAAQGLYNYGFTQNEDFYLEPMLSPVLNSGDTPYCYNTCSPTCGNEIYMSATCENPELAAMWLDYQYTEEGMMLNFYGVEGESYNIVDGEIQFTDIVLNNPDGYTISDALSLQARGNGIGRYNWNVASHYDPPIYNEIMNYWQDNQDFSLSLPARMTMTDAEGTEYSSLYTAIETLTNEKTVQFIMGTDSMDNFDAYVESLYDYGIERCIEIKQASLDRYNAR